MLFWLAVSRYAPEIYQMFIHFAIMIIITSHVNNMDAAIEETSYSDIIKY